MSLYSDKTYENLMESALSRVSSAYDKREGSMIFNGNAPCLAEMAQMYTALDFVLDATYIATAPREYLIKRAADRSMKPYEASAAEYEAYFNIDVPIGSRFSADELNFEVVEALEPKEDMQVFRIRCETSGAIGNNSASLALIPIEYISALSFAEIGEIITYGKDEEETEHFRNRVIEAMRSISFGGNVADYREKIYGYDPSIKGVKVYPVWNENLKPSLLNLPSEDNDISSWYASVQSDNTVSQSVKTWLEYIYSAAQSNCLTVGGTVRVVIQDSDKSSPNFQLVSDIKEYLDPVSGEGLGLAPIGHVVTVAGVQTKEINITVSITMKNGANYASYESIIKKVIEEYFAELAANWEKNECIKIFTSHINSRILSDASTQVENIFGTKVNGFEDNIVLGKDEIPILKTLTNTV